MATKLNQSKALDDFYEKLLFNIFVDCVVVKDTKLFDYTNLKTLKQDKVLPLQLSSLLEKYVVGDTLDKEQTDVKNFFLLYMNYKHLFQLEYFEDNIQKWLVLDNNKLSSFNGKLLCRVVPYINDEIGIIKNDDIQFSMVNQHFILSN